MSLSRVRSANIKAIKSLRFNFYALMNSATCLDRAANNAWMMAFMLIQIIKIS